jgi:apolipoprotein N-acyltransferase
VFTQRVLVHRVPLRDGQTPATRLGALPEWLLAALGLVGLLRARSLVVPA